MVARLSLTVTHLCSKVQDEFSLQGVGVLSRLLLKGTEPFLLP